MIRPPRPVVFPAMEPKSRHPDSNRGPLHYEASSAVGQVPLWVGDLPARTVIRDVRKQAPNGPDVVLELREDFAGWSTVLRSDPCAYCGRKGGTVDHIEPRNHGGGDAAENLTGACWSCNGTKGDRLSVLELMLTPRGEHPRYFRDKARRMRSPL